MEDLTTQHGRLRHLRQIRKLTVPELSERTGIKIDTIKAHEQRNKFNDAQAKKYGKALQYDWLWLLHREGDDPLTKQPNIAGHKRSQPTSAATTLVTIREVDVYAGAGGGGNMPDAYRRGKSGAWLPTEAVKAEVMFPIEWLVSLGLDPGMTDLVRVRGDSMWPEIDDGDWVFVDRRIHQLVADDIYLIFDGFGIVVKSLAIVRASRGDHPKVRILSANSKYPVEEVPAEDVVIIGRVHYRLGRIVRSR